MSLKNFNLNASNDDKWGCIFLVRSFRWHVINKRLLGIEKAAAGHWNGRDFIKSPYRVTSAKESAFAIFLFSFAQRAYRTSDVCSHARSTNEAALFS